MKLVQNGFLVSLVFFSASSLIAASEAGDDPTLEIKDNFAVVMLQDKVLFKLPLDPVKKVKVKTASGSEYETDQADRVYLAGHCLMVQRDAQPGELYPIVREGDVYDVYTKKQVAYASDDPMYWGGDISTSGKWAIMALSEEGTLSGYLFIKPDCSIYSQKFDTVLFGTLLDPSYLKDGSMVFASIPQNESPKKFTVIIHPDGSNELKEESK